MMKNTCFLRYGGSLRTWVNSGDIVVQRRTCEVTGMARQRHDSRRQQTCSDFVPHVRVGRECGRHLRLSAEDFTYRKETNRNLFLRRRVQRRNLDAEWQQIGQQVQQRSERLE